MVREKQLFDSLLNCSTMSIVSIRSVSALSEPVVAGTLRTCSRSHAGCKALGVHHQRSSPTDVRMTEIHDLKTSCRSISIPFHVRRHRKGYRCYQSESIYRMAQSRVWRIVCTYTILLFLLRQSPSFSFKARDSIYIWYPPHDRKPLLVDPSQRPGVS
jgi:hypothetical protein